jgi:hypothetical protein
MDENEKRLAAKIAPEAVLLTLVQAGSFLSAYELTPIIHEKSVEGSRSIFRNSLRMVGAI